MQNITIEDASNIMINIEEMYQELISNKTLDMSFKKVRNDHDQLLNYIDSIKNQNTINKILMNNQLKKKLTNINASMHQLSEISITKKYLSSNSIVNPFDGNWINKGFFSLLNGQVDRWEKAGAIKKDRRCNIAIVGGGALPQTQVYLYNKINCNIVSVERDNESAVLCRKVLNKFGYGHLEVVEEDGLYFDYSQFDIVIVATLVQNKNLIGKRIFDTSNAYFSPRTPLRLHQIWRESVVNENIENLGYTLIDLWEPNNSSVASLTFQKSKIR